MTVALEETVCGKLDWPLASYDTAWDGDAAAQSLADWARKDDGTLDAAKLRQCAFYVDAGADPSKGSSYKLIFCRKGSGGPEIVPQRIFDIAGVLNGAHGGLKGVSDTDQAAIKRKVTTLYNRIAKANPKKEVKPPFEEAAILSSEIRPQKKIATLRVCFLEYNARSLNGRIYPKATCDRIYHAAVAKLANAESLPITCFVSHETANNNVNTDLVGRVTRVWQEGAKFYADIDLADTRTGRDMLALTEGGYMQSESMRVLGVELMHDRNYDLPLVVVQEGIEPELIGIDLTTRPGLMDTARIQQVLYEQEADQPFVESFSLDSLSIASKEEALLMPQSIPLFLKILAEDRTTPAQAEARTSEAKQAHQRVHDHLAGVMDEVCKPIHGSESARLIAAVSLSEEGKAIAQKHMVRLSHAHDESAKQLGMSCECGYRESLGIPMPDDSDTDNDGDAPAQGFDPDNDGESVRQKGTKILTEEEMIAALKAKGFAIEAPKTDSQLLQESFDAKLAAQKQEFEEKLKQFSESAPQRKTLSAGGLNEGGLQPEPLYQEGDYLAGDLSVANWRKLSDRRVPWPKDMDPNIALHELAPFLAYRLLDQEANAMGREISSFVDAHERV